MTNYVMTLRCVDRPGLVGAVGSRLASHGGNITEAQQFNDRASGMFFMRVAFEMTDALDEFSGRFAEDVKRYGLEWTLRPADQTRKVMILVSKFDHCLADLLYRMRIGELNMECVAVVSNHPQETVGFSDPSIPFYHMPVTPETRPDQEGHLKTLIEDTGAEIVVLARYMQILSDQFSNYLLGRCINIHHSFLPGFKGAKPYHQAHKRGVKMIGATAHYVTSDLDEGPIITQDVERVSHADSPDAFVLKGRDIERRVLARAVSRHLEDRVLINGTRTVVFS